MKIEGIEISGQQFESFKVLFNSVELVNLRKVITLYKKHDKSFALFRTQATTFILKITLKKYLNKPLNRKEVAFLNQWLYDSNPMFNDYFTHLDTLLIKG